MILQSLGFDVFGKRKKPSQDNAEADAKRLRGLSADELFDQPLEALKVEEQRLIGIWLDAGGHSPAARRRIDEVKAAIAYHEVGGVRPTLSAEPAKAAPTATPLVRRSTALTAVSKGGTRHVQ